MAKYTLSATVNYPETEAETPTLQDLTERQVGLMVMGLLADERELTSVLITIVKQKED